ncbi:hypothetical protein CASFOL_003683 [Castilleja foliolosa]|uniref:Uncharacterized protein n=1 Tax=Castilleja foliolosa TaxID=1961234 RepID=A0ABD3EHV5_9LAMI
MVEGPVQVAPIFGSETTTALGGWNNLYRLLSKGLGGPAAISVLLPNVIFTIDGKITFSLKNSGFMALDVPPPRWPH